MGEHRKVVNRRFRRQAKVRRARVGSGFVGNNYWTSEQNSDGNHYNVNLDNGNINSNNDTNSHYVVCRQGVLAVCAAAPSGIERGNAMPGKVRMGLYILKGSR